MRKFIATSITVKRASYQEDKDPIGSTCLKSMDMTIVLDISSVGDFSQYIRDDKSVDEVAIAEGILTGKIKIG